MQKCCFPMMVLLRLLGHVLNIVQTIKDDFAELRLVIDIEIGLDKLVLNNDKWEAVAVDFHDLSFTIFGSDICHKTDK